MGIEQLMGDVIQAAEAYGDGRVASETADLNAQVLTLTADLGNANNTITALQSTIALANEQYAAVSAQLDAAVASGLVKDAEIIRLAAEVARLQAIIDGMPGATVTQFGFARPDSTVGFSPPVMQYRTYLGPTERPTTVAGNSGLRRALTWLAQDERAILWLSYKATAGAWLDALLNDIEAKFPMQRIFVTCWHEPFKEWYQTGKTAGYHVEQVAFENVASLHERVERWQILEGYRRPSNTPDYYSTFVRPDTQRLGFDSYNAGIQNPKSYEDPSSVFDEILQFAEDNGTRVSAIGETGTGLTPGDTDGLGRVAWIADVRSYLTGRVETASIWNSEGCTLDMRGVQAWTGNTL